MPASASRNACMACTLAKRACDRQVPRCGRCVDRIVECQYYGKSRLGRTSTGRTRSRPALLAPRPSHQQSLQTNSSQEEETPTHQSLNIEPGPGPLLYQTESLAPINQTCLDFMHIEDPNSPFCPGWPTTMYQPLQIPQSIFIPSPHYNHHALPPKILSEQGWFLHPDSWQIKRTYVPSVAAPHAVFKAFAKAVEAWLRDLATTGHNIFIHRCLYHPSCGGMPSSFQDAWLTLTAYLTKTDQTEELILKILDDRAARLLSEQDFPPPEEINIRTLLAKTQALLIYTFIRLLFDNNPPEQRTKAMDSLPVLKAWCHSLCDAAIAQVSSLYLSSSSSTNPALIELTASSVSPEEIEQTSLWHAFILSESIRRTWMLASSVLRIFSQPPCTTSPAGGGLDSAQALDVSTVTTHRCLGFLSFTIRAGLWDAENAFLWGRLHSSYTHSGSGSMKSTEPPEALFGRQAAGMSDTSHSGKEDSARGGCKVHVPSDGKLWSESKKTIITTFIHDPGLLHGMGVSRLDGSMSVTPVFLESVGILDKILEETTPEDVDSWTNQILRMVLPRERIDRWDGKKRGVGL